MYLRAFWAGIEHFGKAQSNASEKRVTFGGCGRLKVSKNHSCAETGWDVFIRSPKLAWSGTAPI
jgi:hypothetical protein